MNIFALIFSDIGDTIRQALRTMCGRLAAILYNFIVDEYNIFMYIARAEILDDKYIQGIYNKVGLILGIFMIFKLAFSLIQSLINPDTFTDQKKGFAGIIQRSVISIVLLGITPSLFNMALDIQNLIVGINNSNDNVIYKLVVGNTVSESADSFGHVLASDLFFSFYRESEEGIFNQGTLYDESVPKLEILNFETFQEKIRNGGDFDETVKYLTLRREGEYVIDWDEIFSIAVALVVIWLLVIYCIQVAARVVQLAYLQLIAPVPILSYISDPDGAFKNWTKQCATTYLDLFIRLAIIYFIIVLAGQILSAFRDTNSVLMTSTGLSQDYSTLKWVKIFLILGLLMFGKKVPELLKDLFPNMGGGAASLGFGLKSPKKLIGDIPGAGRAISGAVGAAGAAASNAIHGYSNMRKAWKENKGEGFKRLTKTAKAGGKGAFSMVGGAVGGAKAGLKNKDISNVGNAVKVANENREKRELKAQAGYHWYRPDKVIGDKVLAFAGETTSAEKQIKTAEFRRDALQQAKSMQWQTFVDDHATEVGSGDIDLSLLRSMQKFEEKGKTIWRGINSAGKERKFTYNSTTNTFDAADGGTQLTNGGVNDFEASKIVTDSANIDSQIKKQNKTIKGLQTASTDAKK